MSAKLSTTAKCTRIWMISVIVMFLAVMRVPAMNLETSKLVIAWLVILAACLQFAVAAILAPRLTAEQSANPFTGSWSGIFWRGHLRGNQAGRHPARITPTDPNTGRELPRRCVAGRHRLVADVANQTPRNL